MVLERVGRSEDCRQVSLIHICQGATTVSATTLFTYRCESAAVQNHWLSRTDSKRVAHTCGSDMRVRAPTAYEPESVSDRSALGHPCSSDGSSRTVPNRFTKKCCSKTWRRPRVMHPHTHIAWADDTWLLEASRASREAMIRDVVMRADVETGLVLQREMLRRRGPAPSIAAPGRRAAIANVPFFVTARMRRGRYLHDIGVRSRSSWTRLRRRVEIRCARNEGGLRSRARFWRSKYHVLHKLRVMGIELFRCSTGVPPAGTATQVNWSQRVRCS